MQVTTSLCQCKSYSHSFQYIIICIINNVYLFQKHILLLQTQSAIIYIKDPIYYIYYQKQVLPPNLMVQKAKLFEPMWLEYQGHIQRQKIEVCGGVKFA